MSKSTYFTGQPVYSQVIKLLDKAVESTGKCKIRPEFGLSISSKNNPTD